MGVDYGCRKADRRSKDIATGRFRLLAPVFQ
jgi:hypothetical protein